MLFIKDLISLKSGIAGAQPTLVTTIAAAAEPISTDFSKEKSLRIEPMHPPINASPAPVGFNGFTLKIPFENQTYTNIGTNIFTSKFDAPLIIWGCLVKLALQLTNPPSLMNPSNLPQSLLIALLRAAIILMQQSSAALIPSSSLIFSPTLPI